jgi:hypothetical protein
VFNEIKTTFLKKIGKPFDDAALAKYCLQFGWNHTFEMYGPPSGWCEGANKNVSSLQCPAPTPVPGQVHNIRRIEFCTLAMSLQISLV